MSEIVKPILTTIRNRFDEKGIQIPFPHRVLFWGEPKADQCKIQNTK